MAGLRAAWEAEHGPGSVLGLAPSAAAAEVLADEAGIATENLAKWLHEHHQTTRRLARIRQLQTGSDHADNRTRVEQIRAELRRWQPQAGQLIVVDEASLAGTFALDELAAAARDAGAKVVLVGDWAQLTGIEAGGMFRCLVADRDGTAPTLTDVRRFRHEWEKASSVDLRAGREDAIDAYLAHDRVAGGPRSEMLDAVYQAWKTDTDAGMTSLMIAADTATVAELNHRARTGRMAAGQVAADGHTCGRWADRRGR